jgi:hypothetical protein
MEELLAFACESLRIDSFVVCTVASLFCVFVRVPVTLVLCRDKLSPKLY